MIAPREGVATYVPPCTRQDALVYDTKALQTAACYELFNSSLEKAGLHPPLIVTDYLRLLKEAQERNHIATPAMSDVTLNFGAFEGVVAMSMEGSNAGDRDGSGAENFWSNARVSVTIPERMATG